MAHNRIAYNKVDHCEYGFILGGEDWLVENNEVNRLFMYTPGQPLRRLRLLAVLRQGCVQRYNYYHGTASRRSRSPTSIASDLHEQRRDRGRLSSSTTPVSTAARCAWWKAPAHRQRAELDLPAQHRLDQFGRRCNGGWGPDIIQTPDVTIENNTISTVTWAAIGLRGQESTNGQIRNNILCESNGPWSTATAISAARPLVEYNLTFKTAPLAGRDKHDGKDPLFVDPGTRDFRLRQGSPAVGAGKGGVRSGPWTILTSITSILVTRRPRTNRAGAIRACRWRAWPGPATAAAGRDIVLRGGVYHEVLAPLNDGVTIRAMPGEKVMISGADVIEGWRREADGTWSAPWPAEPKKILRDGWPWNYCTYDKAGKHITIKTSSDPRLHVFETVVRAQGIDLAGKKDVKVEEITVVDTR